MGDYDSQFFKACLDGDVKQVEALLPKCNNYMATGLELACKKGNSKVVNILVAYIKSDNGAHQLIPEYRYWEAGLEGAKKRK